MLTLSFQNNPLQKPGIYLFLVLCLSFLLCNNCILLAQNNYKCDTSLLFVKTVENKINGEYSESCGYVDNCGNEIISTKKYHVCFTDTLKTIAIVINKNSDIVAVNKQGKELFNIFNYDNGPDYPQDGLFRIVKNDKLGFATNDGRIAVTPKFEFVYPFYKNTGYAIFNSGGRYENIGNTSFKRFIGGKWGVINKKGEIVIEARYNNITEITKDSVQVETDSGLEWITINN